VCGVNISRFTKAPRRSVGTLCAICEQLRKVNIIAKGEFNEHSTFLLGDRYVVRGDPGDRDNPTFLFVAVLSTEELLLNARRQTLTGQPGRLYVDCSYRYTNVKNVGYLTVKVVSPDQVGHTVAYAILNKEDTLIHKFVFAVVKKEVEFVVNDRIRKARLGRIEPKI
jgi:hypothetical protein